MKRRFLLHGLDSFDDHAILELLLFHAVPRGDTNPTAHALLDRFGSLADVFDAPVGELVKVAGVGEASALLIKLVPQVARRHLISRASSDKILSSPKSAGEYILPYFFGERDEVVYIICMDDKCKVLATKQLSRGGVSSASVNTRKIVEEALSVNASRVILAHNHISGPLVPSEADIETTKRVAAALAAVDISLEDHVVAGAGGYITFAGSGISWE
jgi:DNA repair protein RadC